MKAVLALAALLAPLFLQPADAVCNGHNLGTPDCPRGTRHDQYGNYIPPQPVPTTPYSASIIAPTPVYDPSPSAYIPAPQAGPQNYQPPVSNTCYVGQGGWCNIQASPIGSGCGCIDQSSGIQYSGQVN